MSRKVIEIVQVLVDQIHQGGYTQRALEDDIYAESQKRIAAEKDRDHWKQARQEAIEAGELMRAEIETLRGAMAADDQRLRDAEERVWPGVTWGCDAPDKMADEIEALRKQLDAAKRAASDEFAERQVLTVETQQDAAAWQQQVDSANKEVSYLRARLDEERSVIAGLRQQLRTAAGRVDLTEENNRSLRQQLDAANAAVTLQRAGIERLQEVVTKCRRLVGHYISYADINSLRSALAELDAGTEPTPVAEPLEQAEGGA